VSRGRLLLVIAAVGAGLAMPAEAEGALAWRSCLEDEAQCARLRVPLDRSGAVSGSVSLRVVRYREAPRKPTGVTLVLAGEPGDATTPYLGADEYSAGADLTDLPISAGNDLVAFDQRGTGASGALRCRDLEAATPTDAGREAAACAALLGERRALYRTSETVADIEALRTELGAPRFTIVGSAYGSYVAQRYALRYPDRVQRLVLDLPVDAAGLDALRLDSFVAARRILPLICRTVCRSFTRDPVGDTARLGAQLAGEPLRGYVVAPDGRRRASRFTAQDLLYTLAFGDTFTVGLTDYPAAVVSALRGDAAPLFRLRRHAVLAGKRTPVDVSSPATRAAILCEEARFPWAWRATPAERDAAAAALLTGELAGPFGAAAAIRSDLMRLCRRWPTGSLAPPEEPGPMPDVPVLILVADNHLRAPVETARRIAARFPRAHLLITRSWFGSLLDEGGSACTERALEGFMAGRPVSTRCPRFRPLLPPGRPAPASLAQLAPVRGVPGRRGRALRAVALTLGDWVDEYFFVGGFDPEALERENIRGTGLRGGSFVIGEHIARLDRFEFVPGVRLSLRADVEAERFPLLVDGPGRLDGRLVFRESEDEMVPVRGRLGGRRVRATLRINSRIIELVEENDDGGGGGGGGDLTSSLAPRAGRG
jgi:pimeloyl-ACP methyl ester carboxylesterase